MLEQLREYPEIAELLIGLAQAAPAYSAAIRLNLHSVKLAEHITHASLNIAPAYRDQIGEAGRDACQRDTAVMIRGLAHFLMHSPGDISGFRSWWQKRIGSNIRSKPESFDASGAYAMHNLHEVIAGLRSVLDGNEADTIEAYIRQAFMARGSMNSDNNTSSPRRLIPTVNLSGPLQSVSFADVGN